MNKVRNPSFDAAAFLGEASLGRRIVQLKAKATFFLQGNLADCIFCLQKGRAKLTVVRLTISMLGWAHWDTFSGEGGACIAVPRRAGEGNW